MSGAARAGAIAVSDALPFARAAARFAARFSAPIVLAIFFAVGLAVVDDYGVPTDVGLQLGLGRAAFDHIQGKEDADDNINYGVAFEAPLAVAERVLGEENTRAVYLTRHIAAHAFFLAGGFFCWLLTYRMFGSRLLALFAMLVFLLHPRLYAHSFFNSKDLPFLSMSMICLYLIHRAFRRDTVWAFALCGAGVGLLANIRILGAMPFAAVLGLLALDLLRAVRKDGGAGRVLANGAAFSLAAVLTLYVTWPILWEEPLGFVESFRVMSRFPYAPPELFMGTMVGWDKPPHYVPTWVLITTPPVALVAIIAGTVCAVHAGAVRWRDAIRNTDARFALLLVGFAALPVLAIIVLDSNLYNGWRQAYFIYAPMCPLAALGARGIMSALAERKPRLQLALGALAAVGLAIVVVQMARLHPYQSDYFNLLVNRNVAGQYVVDYWDLSRREALEWLLAAHPDRHLIVRGELESRWDLDSNLFIMPEEARRRVSVRHELPDFHIAESGENPVWTREVYGVPIMMVMDTRAETQAAYRAAYERAIASEPIAESGFDVYLDADGETLIYVKEPCAPDEDGRGRFLLSAFPASPGDLPSEIAERGFGHAPLNFEFRLYSATFDGKCVIMRTLPDFPIGAIETGQYIPGAESLWNVTVVLDPVRIAEYERAYETAMNSEPVAESGFNVYLDEDGKTLIYVREPCAEGDGEGRFQLSVFPISPDDLPADSRERGHQSLNFYFDDYGAALDGRCVIARTLPDFAVGAIETGQYTPEGESLWSVTIVTDPVRIAEYRAAYETAIASEPAAESEFDVYLDGKTLIYVKEPCAEGDASGRFLLSASPISADDLPSNLRGGGHQSLNFYFDEYGAAFGGKCVIARTLPDFPVGAIETGQYIPGGESLWSVTIVTDPIRLAEYRAAYETAMTSEPAAESVFDVYLDGKTLTYVKEPCASDDTRGRFLLSVFPLNADDLPPDIRARGHQSLNFYFDDYGAAFGGKCVIARTLPDFAIGGIETGQYIPGGESLWSAVIGDVPDRREGIDSDPDRLAAYRQAYEVAIASEPIAESGFNVYLDDKTLTYVKEPCAADDIRGRFLLSVFPLNADDLPEDAKRGGRAHVSLNFDFGAHGAVFDGKCAATRTLPDYPIAWIETGQWTRGGGDLWTAAADLDGSRLDAYRQAHETAMSSAPIAEPGDEFISETIIGTGYAIYLDADGKTLIYVKEPCAEEDARGRFLLSAFPVSPNDLPADARRAGREHVSLNFDFGAHGAVFDGKCVIVRALPDYPIAAIDTGQWLPGGDTLWTANRIPIGGE